MQIAALIFNRPQLNLAGVALVVAVCLIITGTNVVRFVVLFPGVAEANAQASILPNHIEADYRVPPPPQFLNGVTANNVYLLAEPPVRLLLLRRNPDEVRPLASLTKLMSALVILDYKPRWNDTIKLIEADRRGGAKARLFVGETVSLRDLWTVALVGSDNDALAALVRGLGVPESTFVRAMNEKAVAFGLRQTHFVEPTGLLPANVSTAREIAIIARAAFTYAEIAQTLAQQRATVAVDGASRIILSSDQYLKGNLDVKTQGWRFVTGKTGYLPESGYNAVVVVEGEDSVQILSVVLGSASLEDRTRDVDVLSIWASNVVAERLKTAILQSDR